MARRVAVWRKRDLSRGFGAVGLAKLAESPLYLGRQVTGALAVPTQVSLVESRAIERGHQVAPGSVAAIRLPLRQFFAQGGHPTAEGTQKTSAEVGLFKHQSKHLLGLAGIVHFLSHDGEDRIFERCQWIAAFRSVRKPLGHPLPEVLYAEREQLFLGAEIAEKSASGDTGVAADFLHRRPVKPYIGKQFPGGPFNLSKDELVFPFTKRPGILRFRPVLAAGGVKHFLHCMQIMAQSAVL
jgi:hypothetical protein